MPTEKKLDKKDLEKLKALLMHVKAKIAGDIRHLENDSLNVNQKDASGDLSGYSFHMADMATDNFDREFNLNLASTEQQTLNMIDNALRKMDDGTFGVCEECTKMIAHKRLMALPYGRLCIKCQEIEEKTKRRS